MFIAELKPFKIRNDRTVYNFQKQINIFPLVVGGGTHYYHYTPSVIKFFFFSYINEIGTIVVVLRTSGESTF